MELEKIENAFAKDCAMNYEKGVEFSVRLSWGPLSQLANFPKNIPAFDGTTTNQKREMFKSVLNEFYEKIDLIAKDGELYELKIQYLPLQSQDYNNFCVEYDKKSA